MASYIGDHPKKFQDRGYVWQKPTQEECKAMGWHYGNIHKDIIKDLDTVDSAAQWLKDNVWWQDYATFAWGAVYFKHERDLLLFKLRWV